MVHVFTHVVRVSILKNDPKNGALLFRKKRARVGDRENAGDVEQVLCRSGVGQKGG